MLNWRENLYYKFQLGEGFLKMSVSFQVIQHALYVIFCIFMLKLNAEQERRWNCEMFEFSYVRGQMCEKQLLDLQRKVAIATTWRHGFIKLPSILLTDLMGYPRRKPAQVFLENGESLGSRDPKKLFYLILLKKVLYLSFKFKKNVPSMLKLISHL